MTSTTTVEPTTDNAIVDNSVTTTASTASDLTTVGEGITTPSPEVSDQPASEVASVVTNDSTSDSTMTADNNEVVSASVVNSVPVSARRQLLTQYGIAFGIVLLMGGALWYLLEEQGRVNTGVFDTIKSYILPAPVAVIVNDIKVPMTIYDKNYIAYAEAAKAQGLDPADVAVAANIKQQAIDILVNTALLESAAMAAGVTVTEEEVEARYQEIVAAQGGEEVLLGRMAELGITTDGLRHDIKQEIMIQTHLAKAVDVTTITVTEAEVKALYDQVAANPSVTLPPLSEVKAQVEQEIRTGKEQELISAYLEGLKTDATIEILI